MDSPNYLELRKEVNFVKIGCRESSWEKLDPTVWKID